MKVILLFSLLFITACVGQTAQTPQPSSTPIATIEYPSGPPPQPSCEGFDAEFLVTQNLLYSEKTRHMEVYLTPSAFSEKNLRVLFACLSKNNPEPHHLTVVLETDWSRVHIPDGKPGSGMSNMPPDPHEYDFLRAIYFRRPPEFKRKEYFSYSPRTKLDKYYWTLVTIKK